MPSLSTFLRALGNGGAVANVRAVLDAHEREDWLVQGLATRLDPSEVEARLEGPATATTAARAAV